MTETNISVVMLTLNEEDVITDTLDTAEPIFDELILVDGDSDDDTVDIAHEWCEDHNKDFDVLHSSEREYLLEGPGTQRRRGEELATNDYTMALGADVHVDVMDEKWFRREFDAYSYSHTRMKKGGRVEVDYRLYCPYPEDKTTMAEIIVDDDHRPRWRGMLHEEIRTPKNVHISDVYYTKEAPMVHKQQRHGAMDTQSVFEHFQRSHDPRVGGNTGRALKKQHYLLHTMLSMDVQEQYVQDVYRRYYQQNKKMVVDDYKDIMNEFDLPQIGHTDIDAEDNTKYEGWEMSDGTPVMDYRDRSALTFFKEKLLG